MATQRWHCSKCTTHYGSEEEAKGCEKNHLTPAEIEVTGIGFLPQRENGAWSFRLGQGELIQRKRPPDMINVRFSKEYGDYASYKLDQYGPKGV